MTSRQGLILFGSSLGWVTSTCYGQSCRWLRASAYQNTKYVSNQVFGTLIIREIFRRVGAVTLAFVVCLHDKVTQFWTEFLAPDYFPNAGILQ